MERSRPTAALVGVDAVGDGLASGLVGTEDDMEIWWLGRRGLVALLTRLLADAIVERCR